MTLRVSTIWVEVHATVPGLYPITGFAINIVEVWGSVTN